jgi:hypothetical protein
MTGIDPQDTKGRHMTSTGADDRRLAGLHAPRRNRYYAGKLLTPSDLEMEQDYLRGADAQLARHVLGAGVVCGLDVTAGDGPSIHVGAGLALDGWGRRVVVPCDVEVALPARAPLAASMVVRLRYEAHEADLAPSVLGDDEDRSEAGTWIEGHRVEIVEGTAPATGGGCSAATLELIRAGQVAHALALLARAACAAPARDPGVTLATITTAADGALTIDACAARAVVPTNVVLLELIACLAARDEECCATAPAQGNDVPLDLTSQ